MVKRILIHVLMGLIIGLIFVFANNSSLLRKVELSLYNWRFDYRGIQDVSEDIVILTIDDYSFGALDTPYPWDRGVYAEVVSKLKSYGAKFVAFDIMFTNKGRSFKGDRAFFDILTKNKEISMVSSKFAEGHSANATGADDASTYTISFEYFSPDDEAEPEPGSAGNVEVINEESTSDKQPIASEEIGAEVITEDTSEPATDEIVEDTTEPTTEEVGAEVIAEDTGEPATDEIVDDGAVPFNIKECPEGDADINEPRYGFVNYPHDPDHQIRMGQLVKSLETQKTCPSTVSIDNKWEPSFSYQILKSVEPDKASALLKKYQNTYFGINYSGPPKSYQSVAFATVYQVIKGKISDEDFKGDNYLQQTPADFFKNKIVLVGATAQALHDTFATPFTGGTGELMPGVEIHANMLDTMRRDNPYFSVNPWINIAIILIFAIGVSVTLAFVKTIIGLLIILGVGSVYTFVNFYFFINQRLHIDLFSPVVVLVMAYGVVYAYRFLVEDKEKRRVRRFFQSYVSPQLVNELLKDPDNMPSLRSERKMVTILFSDIAGFTSMSERLPPDEVEHILNEYLTAMSEIVFGNDGTLDKYIGDAVMALWGNLGINNPQTDAFKAVNTALQMQKRLAELREKWLQEGLVPLQVRIGLNTGEALVGNFGSPQKMDYTVIGDAVNTAARLEGMNKNVGTSILISQSTYDLVKDRIQANNKGVVKVKGKEEGVGIFEVVGWKESAASKSTGMMDTKWMQTSIGKETNWQ